MASVYPGALDAVSTGHVDAETIVPATDNDQADAINKIEAELGAIPSASFADVATRLNARLTCRKTADQTFSSTVTPASVTDMVLPVATTGVDYRFLFEGVYTSAATANGIRLAVTTPAFAGGRLFVLYQIWGRLNPQAAGAAPTDLMEWTSWVTASGTQVASDLVAAANTDYPFRVSGLLVAPSATGNIQLQAANEVSTASGNVIRRGAYGELYIN